MGATRRKLKVFTDANRGDENTLFSATDLLLGAGLQATGVVFGGELQSIAALFVVIFLVSCEVQRADTL